jgi:hypothetical protein
MQAAALCPQCAPPAVRSRSVAFPIDLERQFDSLVRWDLHDPDLGRPIAAPLERCAELLGVDLATIGEASGSSGWSGRSRILTAKLESTGSHETNFHERGRAE